MEYLSTFPSYPTWFKSSSPHWVCVYVNLTLYNIAFISQFIQILPSLLCHSAICFLTQYFTYKYMLMDIKLSSYPKYIKNAYKS